MIAEFTELELEPSDGKGLHGLEDTCRCGECHVEYTVSLSYQGLNSAFRNKCGTERAYFLFY